MMDVQRFDYVIVGSGPSGLACAARLSDNPNVTICVLEAGSARQGDPLIETPALMGQALMNPDYDWCLQTVPQENAGNRQWPLPRGKVVGGSSALNFLCWQRGHQQDFDDMAKLGNPGWDWDSLSPIYKHLTKAGDAAALTDVQRRHGAGLSIDSHGTDGAIDLGHSTWYCEAQQAWRDMLLNGGLQHILDGSGCGQTHGVWNTLVTVNPVTSKRVHAGTVFSENSKYAERSNLTIITNATAARMETGKSNGRELCAHGVTYIQNGEELFVAAHRQVIIAAGTFNSPKLLELSGIGDCKILSKLGIPSLVDNVNVGKNLQEHVYLGSVFEMKDEVITYDKLKDTDFARSPPQGILSSPPVTGFAYSSLQHFMPASEIETLKRWADASTMQDWSDGMKKGYELQKAKLFDQTMPAMEYALMPAFASPDGTPEEKKGYLTPLVLTQYPLSRGTTHIQSKDPSTSPLIDPQYFSNPVDLRTLAYALKASIEQIEKDQALSSLMVKRHTPLKDSVRSIDEYEEYIRQFAGTTYHPVGTCAMMPREMGGVVDANLRVYGTTNVRVADASIMPIMPSGHIQSACYVIGYKAGEILLGEMA